MNQDARATVHALATVNTAAERWRVALDTADRALRSSGCSWTTTLPPEYVHEHAESLSSERAEVERELEALARDEHTQLVRTLDLATIPKSRLGLDESTLACVFELEGVLAPTERLQFEAWKIALDELLGRRLDAAGVHLSHYAPLTRMVGYDHYFRGRSRLDGLRAFLAAVGIAMPDGSKDDEAGAPTLYGVANRKRNELLHLIEHEGVAAYAAAHHYLQAAAAAGVVCGVVSTSANAVAMLERANLLDLVDCCVDGDAIAADGLSPWPEPDVLLAACTALGVDPQQTVSFQTLPAAITAARRAGCARVVGVDTGGKARALRLAGAATVVPHLDELLVGVPHTPYAAAA